MSGWTLRKVANDRPRARKAFSWIVTCPDIMPEPSWENDFGRGMYCGCRRFPTEGKATRYMERMQGNQSTETKES